MVRLIANGVILLFVIWTASISVAAFLNVTIYFPWVISSIEEIPLHRLQIIRISILLTFSHYGILHLAGRNREYPPIEFLTQYLFYLCVAGGTILFNRDVEVLEFGVLTIFIILWLLCVFVSRPLNRDYFKNK